MQKKMRNTQEENIQEEKMQQHKRAENQQNGLSNEPDEAANQPDGAATESDGAANQPDGASNQPDGLGGHKIKAVLFDYDGTLMDTNQIILESWQHTFREIKGREHPEAELYATFGEPLHNTMERFFQGEDVERCVGIYRDYQLHCYRELIKMFPGMAELVKELKARGYLTGVVTSRLPASTIEGLEKYELVSYFDAIVTCADTDQHKPDPEPALVCLEKLGVRPDEAIMIGDTTYDILCGKRAGTKTVLVNWSKAYTPELLAGEAAPDYTLDKATELFDIIEQIG